MMVMVILPQDYDPAADAQSLVDEAMATVRDAHPDVVVRSFVAEGHPAPVLEDASRAADLLVLGCRGHREFPGMLLGSVSMHCVLHAHCPVVVVHQRPSSDEHDVSQTADTEVLR
jgi:nucleotide-binding universal stress UspA family protein